MMTQTKEIATKGTDLRETNAQPGLILLTDNERSYLRVNNITIKTEFDDDGDVVGIMGIPGHEDIRWGVENGDTVDSFVTLACTYDMRPWDLWSMLRQGVG